MEIGNIILVDENTAEGCLEKMASCLEGIVEQKIATDNYEFGEEYGGRVYDKLLLYMEALREAENNLYMLLSNYRKFIDEVVKAYGEVDKQK